MAKPFVKHSCTDEFKSLTVIAEILAVVGEGLVMLRMPPSVQIAAAEMLHAFASAHGNRPSMIDIELNPFEGSGGANLGASMGASLGGLGAAPPPQSSRAFFTNQKLVQRSGCLANIVKGLGMAVEAGDPALQLAVARVLLEASYFDENAQRIADEGVFNHLAPLLTDDFRSPLIFTVSELMWNVLEAAPSARALPDPVVGPFCASLSQAVALALRCGHRVADKEVRNELLITARLLAEDPGTRAGLRTAGLADTALAIAIHPEMGPPPADGVMKPFAMTTAPQDFEMKRLAWLLLAELCGDEDGVEGATDFISCALAFLAPLTGVHVPQGALSASGGVTGVTRWSRSQLRDLQELALRLLTRLAPLCPRVMATSGVCETVVAVMKAESPADDGLRAAAISLAIQLTSLEGFVGRLGGVEAVEAALGVFKGEDGTMMVGSGLVASTEWTGAGESNGHGGIIPADAGYFTDEPSGQFGTSRGGVHPGSSEDPVKLGAAALLAALCNEHKGNSRLFRKAGGVAALKVAIDAMVATDAAVPIAFGAAALSALWRCVVPDVKNCAHFLAGGGMESLLNLLQVCNPTLRPAILSVAADILEKPKSHLFFHDWRSSGGKNAIVPAGAQGVTLVLDLWRAEELKIGVVTDDGVIANPTRPLAGSSNHAKPTEEGLVGTYTMLSRQRAAETEAEAEAARRGADGIFQRVFAVCSLLGFDNLRRCCTPADALTLCTVERYVDFKEGEVWEDTEAAFAAEGMVPTGPDRQAIAQAITAAHATAAELVEMQRTMVATRRKEAADQEAEFYAAMNRQHVAEADARTYKKDRSSLTMKERLEAKLKKEDMLARSFVPQPFEE